MQTKRPGTFGAQLISWVTVLALSLGAVNARQLRGSKAATDTKIKSDVSDEAFLEDLSRRSFQFFWDASDPNTGITREHLYWAVRPILWRNAMLAALELPDSALQRFASRQIVVGSRVRRHVSVRSIPCVIMPSERPTSTAGSTTG
jgi:uncharacterized protein YjeT (DUF2065 family)